MDAPRLASFAEGYGLDQGEREKLPRMLADRTDAMYVLLQRGSITGQQPWARLYAEGHADYWKSAADYIHRHRDLWQQALHAE